MRNGNFNQLTITLLQHFSFNTHTKSINVILTKCYAIGGKRDESLSGYWGGAPHVSFSSSILREATER
jgi:hypothetical protein